MKEIWLPKSETSVSIQDGRVTVTESMVMTIRNVQVSKPGFAPTSESGRDDA